MQISAGDLSAQAEQLEVQLTRTFRVASNWKAVLLLDIHWHSTLIWKSGRA
jgi:hypothetical protein